MVYLCKQNGTSFPFFVLSVRRLRDRRFKRAYETAAESGALPMNATAHSLKQAAEQWQNQWTK